MLVIGDRLEGWFERLRDDQNVREAFSRNPAVAGKTVLVSEPIPVYAISNRQIVRAGLVGAARSGWRCLTFVSRESVAAVAALDLRLSGKMLEFIRAFDGRPLDRMVAAIEKASELPEVKESDFETRILEVPEIPWAAVWLTAVAGGTEDIFFPWAGIIDNLELLRAYQRDTVESVVGAFVGEQVKAEDSFWATKPLLAKAQDIGSAVAFSLKEGLRKLR